MNHSFEPILFNKVVWISLLFIPSHSDSSVTGWIVWNGFPLHTTVNGRVLRQREKNWILFIEKKPVNRAYIDEEGLIELNICMHMKPID